MQWKFFEASDVPQSAIDAWNSLHEAVAVDNPVLDYRFIDALSEYFGDGSELFGVCNIDDQVAAVIILKAERLGVWTAFVPGNGCICPFIIQRSIDPAQVVTSLLKSLPGYSWLLKLPRLDPLFHPEFGAGTEGRTESAIYGTTYAVDVDQTFDDYWAQRKKQLRHNLRKRFAAVEESGMDIAFEVHAGGEDTDGDIAIHGELEGRGWKGESGTAIQIDNIQGRFYASVQNRFAESGGSITARLSFDGNPVASLLCLGRESMVVVLKTAYDPDWSRFSPGRLLDYLFLQWCCEEGNLKSAEMYTRASKSDLSWASRSRAIIDMNIYRSPGAEKLARSTRHLRQQLVRLGKLARG